MVFSHNYTTAWYSVGKIPQRRIGMNLFVIVFFCNNKQTFQVFQSTFFTFLFERVLDSVVPHTMLRSLEVRSHGNADSTAQNRVSAVHKLDKYFKAKYPASRTTWRTLSPDHGTSMFCGSIKEYEDIATFLAQECVPKRTSANDEGEKAQMAMSTAENYFGNIVLTVKQKFEHHSCWQNTVFTDKIAKLRRHIKIVVIRHCISNNIAICKISPAIGREGIFAVCDSYLRCGK